MGINGANFMFRGTGATSPHGWSLPSGSHAGNRALYQAGLGGGGVKNSVYIDVQNYNSCGSSYGNYASYGCGGYGGGIFGMGYGGGGCCGGGIDDKTAGMVFGISAGVGLLASPVGGAIFKGIGGIFKGIGKGCSWAWNKGIKPAANWTYDKILKPAGKGIANAAKWTWNSVLKPAGQAIGNFFSNCWSWIKGDGWGGNKAS